MRPVFRDITLSFAVANLWLFREWANLVPYPEGFHFFFAAPRSAGILAVFSTVLLATGILLAARLIALLTKSPYAISSVRLLYVLCLYPMVKFSVGAANLIPALVALLLLGVLIWHRRVSAHFENCLLPVALLGVVFLLEAVGLNVRYPSLRPISPLAEKAKGSRIVFFIFDELAEEAVFGPQADKTLVPELARFRNEALTATRALPPGKATIFSIPSYILGRQVAQVCRDDVTDLEVLFNDERTGSSTGFKNAPNLFERMRALGRRTGLSGWHLPYCRLLGNQIDRCLDLTGIRFDYGPELVSNVVKIIGRNLRGEWTPFMEHRERFEQAQSRALSLLSDSSLDFEFIHFPAPHLPAILTPEEERVHGQTHGIDDYFHNVRRADEAWGKFRRTLEVLGQWDSTTVLITSDHAIHAWRNFVLDQKEPFASVLRDRRVPFLLKLAGQKSGTVYTKPFNTLLAHDLVLAVAQAEIKTVPEAIAWLDARGPETTGLESQTGVDACGSLPTTGTSSALQGVAGD